MMHRKMTPKGQMSNSGLGPAIANLPIALKSLFEPRPPLEYKRPIVKRKMPPLTGLAAFTNTFEKTPPPTRVVKETPSQKSKRLASVKAAKATAALQSKIEAYHPVEDLKDNPDATDDAFKTLFVGRLGYDVTTKALTREMESYGPVTKVRIVEDKNNAETPSRGYGFVEFETEEDMKAAYRKADGRKLDGRRVVVDVERGRTVKDWKPRRLGGGIGDTRKGSASESKRYSGREELSYAPSYRRNNSSSTLTSEYSRRDSKYGGSDYRGGRNDDDRSDYRGGYRRDSNDYHRRREEDGRRRESSYNNTSSSDHHHRRGGGDRDYHRRDSQRNHHHRGDDYRGSSRY